MIAVKDLSLRQGKFHLEGVSPTVPTGQSGVLMGKTGSGKTTVLEAVAGLRPVERGAILLNDKNVTDLAPAARGVGYVPQDGALFRTMTVRDHLAFALVIRKAPWVAVAQRVEELAVWLG